jgi:quercetin dioxygenase-like cupin family protein
MSPRNAHENHEQPGLKVTPWPGGRAPTEAELRKLYAAEGMAPYRWSNGAHDRYQAHSHGYHKVIYVVSGSITFGLPQRGESVSLAAGDRLDLPAGVLHDAVVGSSGVICLEGHRN